MTAVLLVAVCGGLGAAARLVVDGVVRSRWTTDFPLATVVVNVSGSLVAGLVVGAVAHLDLAPWWSPLAVTGFAGGYTTFSTAMVEAVRLVQSGQLGRAALSVAGTLVLCVAAAALGVLLMWSLAEQLGGGVPRLRP